jgi:hypothetical protein
MHGKWSKQNCPVETSIVVYLIVGGLADIGWAFYCIVAPCYVTANRNFVHVRTEFKDGKMIPQIKLCTSDPVEHLLTPFSNG